MSREKKDDFELFYTVMTQQRKIFNFKKEFEDYCWSDVMLLTEGCMKYSKLSRENSKLNESDVGYDPLVNCVTLASACNKLYRRNYMPSDMIATLPSCGFNPKSNLSKSCELWLKWVSESQKIYGK
jgi:hypothetical protein